MRVILRQPREATTGKTRYQQLLFDVERLTIGSGADQHVCVPDPQLPSHYAVIWSTRRSLRIRARGPHPVTVNGVRRWNARLHVDDIIALGASQLTVEALRDDGVAVLRLRLAATSHSPLGSGPEALNLRATGLRQRPWVWRAIVAVAGIAFTLPLVASLDTPLRDPLRAAALIPSDGLWQPGPLHAAHQSIGGNCNACHQGRFERVPDSACLTCHRNTEHHFIASAATAAVQSNERCAGCHVEHGKPTQLVDDDSRFCARCHESLRQKMPSTKLQDAGDFSTQHPEFTLAASRPERSNLIFSHAVHCDLRGIKSPKGREVLRCASCHQPDAGGRYMQPVKMQTHCERCHELRFDEHDPASSVPHGDLPALFEALRAHFSSRFLEAERSAVGARRRPGAESIPISSERQRLALDWSTRQSLIAAKELLERRSCVQCHVVTHVAGGSGFAQWRVEPVKIIDRWMPRASFDHAKHVNVACVDCHHGALQSKASGDVLMPVRADCRRCHGGSADRQRLASDCVMCHAFHRPGAGLYPAAAVIKK